ncbi:MAG: hypothetical protein J6O39_00145 [Treponema sp.]|nr:hypothetical protein [Treponema sp.]
MNKILKILSILVIGFVMFSCSTPTNDPVEETPEVPTYSIIFTTEESIELDVIVVDHLNTLPKFKNLEEGTEIVLPKRLYLNRDGSEITEECAESSIHYVDILYNHEKIDSVVIGNEDVELEVSFSNVVTFKD